MYRKVILALLLVMHYSLAFGAIEAAAMPDEQHPLGKAVHHDHHHSHDDDHGTDHIKQNNAVQHETVGDVHDHQHKHGINIQLNVDIPSLFALDFFKTDSLPATPYRLDHDSLSYAPAVPPPDRL